jgi:hypothetical protein
MYKVEIAPKEWREKLPIKVKEFESLNRKKKHMPLSVQSVAMAVSE